MPEVDSSIDFNRFAVALLEDAHTALTKAMNGLTDEQLSYRPARDANSIAWLAWHLSRWKDRYSSTTSGEPQVWASEGWAERFGMDAEDTGWGHTPEQVAAFRVERDLLLGYVEAAHRATVERVSRMTPEDLERPYQSSPMGTVRSAWRGFIGTAMDFTQHTGQVAYLRGLLSGLGWR